MTDDSTLPPDWAIEKAVEISSTRFNLPLIKICPSQYKATIAFAKYIAEHEPAPVDPDVLFVRRWLAKKYPDIADKYSSGEYDEYFKPTFLPFLKGYKEECANQGR